MTTRDSKQVHWNIKLACLKEYLPKAREECTVCRLNGTTRRETGKNRALCSFVYIYNYSFIYINIYRKNKMFQQRTLNH